jgi:WhiB family transcriptional regulator, redox-sensing transcriptional regulator
VALAIGDPGRVASRAAAGWEGEGWRADAACRDLDANLFFPAGETGPAASQIVQAKAICASCPVKGDCLQFALLTHQDYGIWGGTTEDERRQIRRAWRARARARAS